MSNESPTYKLYSPWAIGAVASAGGIFVGALMIAMNYRRLGKSQAAWQTVALGMTAGLLVLIAFMCAGMPKSEVVEYTIRIAQGFCAYFAAKKLQGETIKQHIGSGGAMADSIMDLLAIGSIGVLTFIVTIITSAVIWEVAKSPIGMK